MRSGLLIVPDGMSVEALKGEAEFYLVTDFLAKLQEQEEEEQKKAEEQQKCQPILILSATKIVASVDTGSIRLGDQGCYVNESKGEAFLFFPNDKLTCVRIPDDLRQQFSAYDQAMVSHTHLILIREL